MSEHPQALPGGPDHRGGFTNAIVRIFLNSNLPLIFIILATAIGATALMVTPREEDPQIVVPMADVYVNFPGHSAKEVEQLIATPLEKLLYQIDGVEYVYSMSRQDQAIITVRYYVGQDRERSLVKLHKKIDESLDTVPPGVTGWVIKPIEIDDVPIVTLTLTDDSGQADASYQLRRQAEELVNRLAATKDVSRAYVVGGQPRTVHVYLDNDRMQAYGVSSDEIQQAIASGNTSRLAGDFRRNDRDIVVEAGTAFDSPRQLQELVINVAGDRPVFLKDVADIQDGPAEITSYVRHGWGPAHGFAERPGVAGTTLGEASGKDGQAAPAVTIAIAKKKGTNAVTVADEVLAAADDLRREILPSSVHMTVTRNAGISSNDKVNDLIEALAVALIFAIAILLLSLGWREALIVALAVPVVFGLTLAVNLLAGLTINRVTLFALILSLGLLVDDPIVDVENIVRHFALRRKATRQIVMEAVSEIRPPLITATIAVIFSFLPLFFITGMMGPYMRPMALNVPVTMVMSMAVAFMITPWLAYHFLKKRYNKKQESGSGSRESGTHEADFDPHAVGDVKQTWLYRVFYPLMAPLLKKRWAAITFLLIMGGLMMFAVGLAATRRVPLKMLPYGNKDDLQLVLDFDEGTTLERTDAAVRDIERYVAQIPEVTDYTSYVGLAAPMDFNGMVRHYYLRRGDNVADVQLNFAGRKERSDQTHEIALRVRDDLTAIARKHNARIKVIESPPGPPVLSTVVAEVYGQPDTSYDSILAAADVVRARLQAEPGVVDVDDMVEAAQTRLVFTTDKEKAAISGISTQQISQAVATALGGNVAGVLQVPNERNALQIELRLPQEKRSSAFDLSKIGLKGRDGQLVSLAELGKWETTRVEQTIYHKNLQPVMYVTAEMAGRTPAEAVVDIKADQVKGGMVTRLSDDHAQDVPTWSPPKQRADDHATPASAKVIGNGWVSTATERPPAWRTFITNGGGVAWAVPRDIRVSFGGEGEWQLTLDVFRDMGLAFAAALVAIYILLVGQTRSFAISGVVMLAIPLTIIGIMPGFWLLGKLTGGHIGGYANPVFFTATAMIGMIALAGIVTRSSIILVDFIHLSLSRGRSLFDAIMESSVVRLRPILLTAATAMLSAVPITTDPVFSGLAWALIFGLLASTAFTLFVIPVVYYLIYANKPGHGLARTEE